MTQFAKTTRQLLFEMRYESSRQDTQRLQREFAELRKSVERVEDTNERSTRSFRESTQALDREAAAAREAAGEYDRLAREKAQAAQADRQQRLGGIADFGARGSSVAGAFAGGTEFANVLGLLDDATTAFAQFGVAGAGLSVGVGVVSLAFAELTRQMEEAKEKAEEYINAQRDLNEQIAAGATSSDLVERRDALQVTLEGLNSTVDDYADIIKRFDDAIAASAADNPLGLYNPLEGQSIIDAFNAEITAMTNGVLTNIQGAKDATAAQERAVASVTAQIELYNRALENSETAVADARASAIALEDNIRNIARSTAEQSTATEQSSEALRNRQIALTTERAALESSIEALRKQATVTNGYDQVADNLQRTVAQLTTELERNNIAFREALGREEAAALTKEYSDLTTAMAKNKATLKELREAGVAAYDAMLTAVAKIEADAEDARAKALAEAADAQSEAYVDHLESLAQIEKRAYRDIQDAVANRDAIAFVRAKTARQDALDEERANYAKRERELQKTLDKQLQQIKDNADKAIQAQRDQYYKESALRVQQYQQILADQVLLQQRLDLINQIGLNNAEAAATQYWTTAEKLANDALAALYTASAANPTGFGTSMVNGTGGNNFNTALGNMMTQAARREINATLKGYLASQGGR